MTVWSWASHLAALGPGFLTEKWQVCLDDLKFPVNALPPPPPPRTKSFGVHGYSHLILKKKRERWQASLPVPLHSLRQPSNRSPEGAPLLWKVCTYICIFWWSLNLLPEWCKWSPWLSDFQQVHRSLCELFKFTPSPHVPCIHATLFLLCKSHLQHLSWLTDMAGTRGRCQQAWPSALWRLILVGNAEMLSIQAW